MRRMRLIFAILLATAEVASLGTFGSAANAVKEKVVLGGIAATMTVIPVFESDFLLRFQLSSSTYPTGCLSAYRDFRYELRSASGQIIAVDPEILKHPPYDGPKIVSGKAGNRGYGCEGNAIEGVWQTTSRLSPLYPNLPPGNYTLRVTLAPRDMTQHADFVPVPISILPDPR